MVNSTISRRSSGFALFSALSISALLAFALIDCIFEVNLERKLIQNTYQHAVEHQRALDRVI